MSFTSALRNGLLYPNFRLIYAFVLCTDSMASRLWTEHSVLHAISAAAIRTLALRPY